MSNVELEKRVFVNEQTIEAMLNTYAKEFNSIVDNDSQFMKEKKFAIQAFTKNPKLFQIVNNTAQGRMSLQYALSNLASIGLTLNPLIQLCHLVPRGNEVVLDVGYRGLLDIAMRTGIIKMAICDIVKEGDEFIKHGLTEQPEHRFDPFAAGRDQLKTVGAYCCAQLANGLWKTETMSVAELNQVNALAPSSPAWKKWPGQMQKKTVLKRAANMWGCAQDSALHKAIEIDNKNTGYTFDNAALSREVDTDPADAAINKLQEMSA